MIRSLGSSLVLATLITVVACKSQSSTSSDPAVPSASASAASRPLATSWHASPGKLLGPGDAAPRFEAIAHTGQRVRLASYLQKPVIVYFYPKDGTPGCTVEAQQIRDAWLHMNQKVGMVFGVSTDDNVTHRAFAEEHKLPFLLLSDVDGAIARAFGVSLEGGRVERVTFVVGTDGKVTRVFDDVTPDGHAAELLAALAELG